MLHILKAHENAISVLAFDGSAKHLVSGASDACVKVWSFSEGYVGT